MREIEFRAKDFTGEWRYGYIARYRNYKNEVYTAILPICDNETQETSVEDITSVDSNTIGQYTGLKDKNGTKIFEGDILQLCDGTYPCLIYWSGIGWALKRNNKRVDYAFGCDLISDCEKMEVIGNIYDNPELLGE